MMNTALAPSLQRVSAADLLAEFKRLVERERGIADEPGDQLGGANRSKRDC